MENSFSHKMATKSTEELETILKNKRDYQEDAILAAIWELENRGAETSQKIGEEITTEITKKKEQKKRVSNYTTDPNAPELYPWWSIGVISVLFTPLIGGIMMAMNFKKANIKKQIPIVLAFSILFTVMVAFIVNYVRTEYNSTANWANILNLIGAAILSEYFWKQKIGNDFEYRKRSPMIPFIISIAITAFFIWVSTLG
ncbi:hypothetical protein EV198_2476 [Roseivirga ehrenbergii]|uniref:Uncharacterized protein n=1 Tax=Roseivirga ehrenbergii (strain DSM 102268 / JCM 13514 / KCTC 12282 / NCIMB 14502 / KMM 6017) TaxID=279360 RepID=A0A150XT64_ROSEK|nr:hypothetical protein [Roseivirga ehrenbergii]KYG81874.1 hypothetical protein MB14_00330 [Roseivirga ehrenbergii]TCL01688.1 hypothetical protein EV198_2476 [Roseivirga ehrenbergii]